ncbi:MAG: hypothetical protein WBC34_13860, partial [Thiofilum sp.]
MNHRFYWLHIKLKLKILLFSCLFIFSNLYAGEYVQFQKMWPNLVQPLYFYSIGAAIFDSTSRTFLVMDKSNGIITRLSSNNNIINRWGGKGKENGHFSYAGSYSEGLANNMDIDAQGNIYITDPFNYRVQIFSYSGNFLSTISFDDIPLSVAVSNEGLLAILFSNRLDFFKNEKYIDSLSLEKEYSDLVFLNGTNDFYLVSAETGRYYTYANKKYVEWQMPYYANGIALLTPVTNISVDDSSNLVFSITASGILYKYNKSGQEVYKRKYFKSREDFQNEDDYVDNTSLYMDRQVAGFFDDKNSLYLIDQNNLFISKVNLNDESKVRFGASISHIYDATGYPLFSFYDNKRKIYIVVSNESISIFDSDFKIISNHSFFETKNIAKVYDVSFNSSGKVIVGLENKNLKKVYLTIFSLEDMLFEKSYALNDIIEPATMLYKIYIDSDDFGNIFLLPSDFFPSSTNLYKVNTITNTYEILGADSLSLGYQNLIVFSKSNNEHEIYISYSQGDSTVDVKKMSWSNEGLVSLAYILKGATIQNMTSFDGALFLIDGDFNLLEFREDKLVKEIKLGGFGVDYSKYSDVNNITINSHEAIITERNNMRLQVLSFKDVPDRSKAVLVVGGDESGNALWDESQANANHAFWVLANQGYTKENIQYLNRNT